MNRQTAIKQLEAISIELYDYEWYFEDDKAYLVRRNGGSESYIGWSSGSFVMKREHGNMHIGEDLMDAFRLLTITPKMTPEEERQFLTLRSEYDRTLCHFRKAEREMPECKLAFSKSCLRDGSPERVELVLGDSSGCTTLRWSRDCGKNAFTVRDWNEGEFLPLVRAFDTFTEALLCFKGIIGS